MCGRFTQKSERKIIGEEFYIQEFLSDVFISYNVAPGQEAGVILNSSAGGRSGNRYVRFRWGLVPFWADDQKTGYRMINARAETVSEKPSFKNAFTHRRCLVPADGFYEWKKNVASKTPFYIYNPSGRPMSLAGLWEAWTGKPEKKGGSADTHELPTSENFENREGVLYTFTIITTAASAKMAPLHDRIPVIVPPGLREQWLDSEMKDHEKLEKLLIPAPDDDIAYHEVSRMVNSPGNNVQACIEAV